MHARCTMSIVFLRPKIVFGNETGIVESESSGSLGGEEFASSKPLAYVQQVSIRRFFFFSGKKNLLKIQFVKNWETWFQVLVKAMVHPYRKDRLITKDAFRGPLATAFKLHLEHLTTFKDSIRQDSYQSSISLWLFSAISSCGLPK